MAPTNWGRLITETWIATLEDSPRIFDSEIFFDLFQPPHLRKTYRDWLDRREHNYMDKSLPRSSRVKRNLRALGEPHLPASRLPQ